MNPNRGEGQNQANFELPPAPESEDRRQEHAAEAPPAAPERAAQQPRQPALPAVPDDIPAVDQPIIAVPPDDAAAPAATVRQPAADADRIEREWVDKAKAIVAKTQDDPYAQKTEMSKIKADYIQKRFNKTIKTDEAAA